MAAKGARAKNARRKADGEVIARRATRRRRLAELREETAEFSRGLRRNVDPADAVQEVLDNVVSAYQYATQNVMMLTEDEYFRDTMSGKVPHEWIREHERLGLQLVHVARQASGMGLAERQVRLQEQQAALFAGVVEAALVQLGLTSEQRTKAHGLIAERLADVESTAVEIAA